MGLKLPDHVHWRVEDCITNERETPAFGLARVSSLIGVPSATPDWALMGVPWLSTTKQQSIPLVQSQGPAKRGLLLIAKGETWMPLAGQVPELASFVPIPVTGNLSTPSRYKKLFQLEVKNNHLEMTGAQLKCRPWSISR